MNSKKTIKGCTFKIIHSLKLKHNDKKCRLTYFYTYVFVLFLAVLVNSVLLVGWL